MKPFRRALRAAWYALRHEPDVTPDGTYILIIEKGSTIRLAAATLDVKMDIPAPRSYYTSELTYHTSARYGTFSGTLAREAA